MGEIRICDVCKEGIASRSFKVKLSKRGIHTPKMWDSSIWTSYEKIDICGECAEKILKMSYRDKDGLSRPPKIR